MAPAKYVYDFNEGETGMKRLLGGKGANLAEMTRMELPVPPGFTITTEACNYYYRKAATPRASTEEIEEHLQGLEKRMGKKLGDPKRSPPGVGAFRRRDLHARDDGHRAQPGPQRRFGAAGWPRSPATSVSPTMPTAASSPCSRTSSWRSNVKFFEEELTRKKEDAGRQAGRRARRRGTGRSW